MKSLFGSLPLLLTACAMPTERVQTAPAVGQGSLFVAGKFQNVLSKVDLASGKAEKTIETCANPHELAVSPDKDHVALACYGGRQIVIYDTDGLKPRKRLLLGEGARPHGIVWHSNGDLYATAEGRKSIYWIRNPMSASPDILEYATGKDGSHMLAVAPDGRHAWTTDLGSKTVTRIDLVTRRAPLSMEVGEEPEGIALSPDGETLWISARGSDKAFALDPRTLDIRDTIDTGDFPLRIVVRPQGDFAVTSDLADGGLTVIDTATGEAMRQIAVSSREEAESRQQITVLFSPDGERIYVAETRSDTVAEVDFASGRVLRRLPGTGGGDGMAIVQ